ncbi:MAG: A/G-specific adenine glycosylase [Lachnospiraceae bacterium]|nr:A/G-specific adenine glycosylase [Lachnospiraceae bacterium]
MGRVRSEKELYRETVPALLAWYSYNARILPWREDPTPYHVWISEIMLQQTRVEAVRGYYDRFLREFPTVAAVAGASEDRLIKMWEGLGYYSRVRNIAKAARELCERYDGELPADCAMLRELPGIGDYTAGAIASIAYGIRVPAVDGNVLRVFSRLTGYRDDIRTEVFKKQVRDHLQDALENGDVPEERCESRAGADTADDNAASFGTNNAAATIGVNTAGAFNQAVMDLGATVCIPNGKPHCDQCPLSHLCRAFAEGLADEIPKKPERKARPVEKKTILVIADEDGRVLLHRRPPKGLLAGMWEFPNVPGHLSIAAAKKEATGVLAEAAGQSFQAVATAGKNDVGAPLTDKSFCAIRAHRLEKSRHVFSHVEWELRGFRLDVASAPIEVSNGEYVFATPQEIAEEYGLPQAFGAYRLHA